MLWAKRMVNADEAGRKAKNKPQISVKRSTRYKLPFESPEVEKRNLCIPPRPQLRESARMIKDTPESRLASLQRKFRLLSCEELWFPSMADRDAVLRNMSAQ
jgi:hypothetical protein